MPFCQPNGSFKTRPALPAINAMMSWPTRPTRGGYFSLLHRTRAAFAGRNERTGQGGYGVVRRWQQGRGCTQGGQALQQDRAESSLDDLGREVRSGRNLEINRRSADGPGNNPGCRRRRRRRRRWWRRRRWRRRRPKGRIHRIEGGSVGADDDGAGVANPGFGRHVDGALHVSPADGGPGIPQVSLRGWRDVGGNGQLEPWEGGIHGVAEFLGGAVATNSHAVVLVGIKSCDARFEPAISIASATRQSIGSDAHLDRSALLRCLVDCRPEGVGIGVVNVSAGSVPVLVAVLLHAAALHLLNDGLQVGTVEVAVVLGPLDAGAIGDIDACALLVVRLLCTDTVPPIVVALHV